MEISFDPAKRDRALAERGLDFADAAEVFGGPVFERDDDRFDYGERRIITAGLLAWNPRGAVRHIISMRKANDREQARYKTRLG